MTTNTTSTDTISTDTPSGDASHGDTSPGDTTTIWLAPSAIEPNPFNPRRYFGETEIAELAASIREQGLLQPILVRPLARKHKGITHQLVLGERRWRALLLLEWESVEARCRPLSDAESAAAALTENIQRQDITDYEEAAGLLTVIEQSEKEGRPLGVTALMQRFGKSETYIRNRLGLFDLKPDVQELTKRHRMVMSSAYKINKVPDAQTRRELIELVDNGASFKTIESQIEQLKADTRWRRDSQRPPDPTTRAALQSQQARLSEAQKQVETALAEADRHLINAAAWMQNLPQKSRPASIEATLTRLETRLKSLRHD